MALASTSWTLCKEQKVNEIANSQALESEKSIYTRKQKFKNCRDGRDFLHDPRNIRMTLNFTKCNDCFIKLCIARILLGKLHLMTGIRQINTFYNNCFSFVKRGAT